LLFLLAIVSSFLSHADAIEAARINPAHDHLTELLDDD
jgi:hypothetical protein